jgi:hypothetical protein
MDYEFSFHNDCSKLAPLETFDPQAFLGDDRVPQSLCNFILILALVFNDLRDLYYANVLLGDCKPVNSTQKSRHLGSYSGLYLHVIRLIMGSVHELLNAINEQRGDLESPFFREVVRGLPMDTRDDWNDLVKVAQGITPTEQKLNKLLLRIRNNLSFHYDPRAAHAGFKKHFVTMKADNRGYVSRGDSIQESRFYFADAAVQGLLLQVIGEESDELSQAFDKLLGKVCRPIMLIVAGFIQKRGFAFRTEV